MSEVRFEGVRLGKPKYDMGKDEFTLPFIVGGWNQYSQAVREVMGVEGTAALTVKGSFQAHIDEEIERQQRAEAEKEQVAIGGEPPDRNTLEVGLWQALHATALAADKWNVLRDTGANDELLLVSIEQEFEQVAFLATMYDEEGKVPYRTRGEGSPAFWWGATTRRNRPTLHDEKLLAKVREVLSIPLPKPEEREPGADDPEEEGYTAGEARAEAAMDAVR